MKDSRIARSQGLAQGGVIFAPASFLLASLDELTDICNGCGTSDSWFRPPEKFYGTNIIYACIIHDYMYHKGFTIEDKQEADRVFLNNMNRLITRDKHLWYKPTFLQRECAVKYYYMVKYYGAEAFWKGKN